MFNDLLFLDTQPESNLTPCLRRSLALEGYEITLAASLEEAAERLQETAPDLVVINTVGLGSAVDEAWLRRARSVTGERPTIVIVPRPGTPHREEPAEIDGLWRYMVAPFAFQDLLLVVQDMLYQRTLSGQQPFQLSAPLLEKVDEVLTTLRSDLRARCVVLSTSGGRLIKTTGVVEQGVAISLAALMSASFTATSKAAQMLGQSDMFDSSLQESEGYGLYAIRLHNKLVLSVAFSARITVGMVRHYAAQAAVDILEILIRDNGHIEAGTELSFDHDFRQTVNQALGDILGH
jgi:DNA-binding response OmpR family regulator